MKRLVLALLMGAMVLTMVLMVIDGSNLKRDYLNFKDEINYEMVYGYGDDVAIDLPQDAKGWYTVVFTSENWQQNPQEYRLIQWFNTYPGLVNLKQQTKFMHLTPKNSIYKNYNAYTKGGTQPAVILTDEKGVRVYGTTGHLIPKTAVLLFRAIKKFIIKHCPNCPKPDRPYKPHVPDAVPEYPYQPYYPDTVDEDEEIDAVEKEDGAWIFAIVGGIATFAVVFLFTSMSRRPDGT